MCRIRATCALGCSSLAPKCIQDKETLIPTSAISANLYQSLKAWATYLVHVGIDTSPLPQVLVYVGIIDDRVDRIDDTVHGHVVSKALGEGTEYGDGKNVQTLFLEGTLRSGVCR